MVAVRVDGPPYSIADATASEFDEKTPLLSQSPEAPYVDQQISKAWLVPKRISEAVIATVKVLLTAVVVPGRYVIACFYDDGHYSVLAPVYKISRKFTRTRRKMPVSESVPATDSSDSTEKGKRKSRRLSVAQTQTKRQPKRTPSIVSTSTAMTSDSELDSERPPTRDENRDTPARNTRSKSGASSAMEEIAPAKRSIRIKLHNEDALRQRKARKSQTAGGSSKGGSTQVSAEAAAALKSPISSATASSKMTRFPRAPQPPRPLVPRRQPSYSTSGASAVGPHQKTLIIDLDETLIHSMAKGGRYTTGHMVEVKLQQPVGVGGGMIGPQVPILYYVHKRPHCDEFLKKVCKWYNLIVFTASVQEYADPVIDWLEIERKYFAGRYYRQHCTFRNGAYIKDLAQVEPDLSKVMILDNSPMSYIFHEVTDNAIPIEGWINDPTDNDLLHLIPLLEGLQYVTDVRALLALRLGEPQSG
ncbi:NLI interacting factor-like phosphatase-domain-containing protein [Clohesyomyces aquaticus]|uniref:NLI interacting factor-like phosphatase-domain-containing protein n=1 Tax=Clohesyomyces aquaticus TaxID=1231657 RepID=A0A1Y1ZPS8_9PLEO|nr:NLI interacting factor-like phosphatase-domain-containing protein [Clohesyomyces aquaticus]